MKELTTAEEEVMQILWQIEKGFVRDILDYYKKPKPAYNTISTIVRILETKGFVDHHAYGKSHEYFPLITKDAYKKSLMKSVMKNYFDDSYKSLVSFFVKQGDLSAREVDDLLKDIAKDKKGKK